MKKPKTTKTKIQMLTEFGSYETGIGEDKQPQTGANILQDYIESFFGDQLNLTETRTAFTNAFAAFLKNTQQMQPDPIKVVADIIPFIESATNERVNNIYEICNMVPTQSNENDWLYNHPDLGWDILD